VLLPLVVSLALSLAGLLVVAKVTQLALTRLGLELFTVLEWLGLAETPLDELTARREGVAPSKSHHAASRAPKRGPTEPKPQEMGTVPYA
jgi:hypothetical protein